MFPLPALGTLPVLVAAGALYMRSARRPSVIEGLAFSWVGGWAGVNLALFSLDQFLGIRLDGAAAAALSFIALALAVLLLWPVRSRIPSWLAGLWGRARHVLGALRREPPVLAGALLLVVFLGLALFKAGSLPVMNTDGVAYHAVIPRQAFQSGSLPDDVGPSWTEWARAFPGFFETQQLWLYLLDGSANDLWARLLVPVSFGLLALLAGQQARRHGGSRLAAMVAPMLLLSLPELPIWSTQFFVEVPVALATLSGAALLLSGLEEDNRRLLALAGLALGAAGLVKYNGVIIGAVLVLCGAVLLRSRPSRVPFLVIPWAVPLVLFLGRNWLFFGNPIYPFFAEVFEGKNLGLLSLFPVYPQTEFSRARVFETVELLSALPLVVGLAAIVGRRFRSAPLAWKLLLGSSLLYMLVYLFFQFRGSHIRYIFPVLPMLAVTGGWLVADAAGGDRRAALSVAGALAIVAGALAPIFLAVPGISPDRHALWVAESFIAVAAGLAACLLILHCSSVRSRSGRIPRWGGAGPKALGVAIAVMLFLPSLPTMLVVGYPGEERADSDPAKGLSVPDFETVMTRRFGDDYQMWKWVNANLPRNATIVSFDPRIYYIEREVLPASSYKLAGTYNVPLEKAVEAARRQGATHILDSPWPRGIEVIRPFYERSALFQDLGNATFFSLLHAQGEVRLYELAGGGGGPEG